MEEEGIDQINQALWDLNAYAGSLGITIDFSDYVGMAIDCYGNEDVFISFHNMPNGVFSPLILLFDTDTFEQHYNFYDDKPVAIRLSHLNEFKLHLLNKKSISKDEVSKTYFMKDKRNGFIKIGKSKNPTIREKTLQSEEPAISIVFVINKDIETELHRRFKSKRVRGEWFQLSPEDIDSIKNQYAELIMKSKAA
jgi:hypothetical protein